MTAGRDKAGRDKAVTAAKAAILAECAGCCGPPELCDRHRTFANEVLRALVAVLTDQGGP